MTAIVDSLFAPHNAIHANGDRYGFRPSHVHWRRLSDTYASTVDRPVWWTDGHVPPSRFQGKQIGLLLEPPDIHPENYQAANDALVDGRLDVLFTHQQTCFSPAFDVWPFPLGGTMIHPSDWRIWDKKPAVSAIASDKRGLDGHWLRHEVIAAFQGTARFHAYGPNYTPIPLNRDGFYHKLPALQDYAYSLAIECVNTGLILSEHVLDCFLTGTVPIYWGPRDALRHWGFDELGVFRANTKEGLIHLVKLILAGGMNDYEDRRGAIERNFIRAHEFTCPEDWLYRNYPELFDE